ncbi:MAG: DNA recombination protein RmuC [Candidatus Acidiferrales bacterium]
MPSPVVWIVIAAVMLAAIIVAALVRSTARRTESQLSDARQEMQNSLTAQGQAVTSQLNHLVQSVTQQLGQVRQELQTGIASSGQITADAQRSVSQQLHSATEAVRQISQQLGAVQKAGDDLTRASQTMQQVLGGAKSRGTLGEIALERLLEDSLPQINYSLQHRFSTGDIVDAVIRSAERLLPIDSKFPLDSYRRLVETGEESRKEFAQAVRKHADSIASKYILPGDHTLDIALMFVPSETIYYELLMTDDPKAGRLDEYCRRKAVIPVSPNTLFSYLNMILMGLRGMQIEENARRLLGSLAGVAKQMDTFSEVFEKLGTHLRHSQQSYEEATSRLVKTQNSLQQMSQGALPESGALNALEAATPGE